KWFATGCEESPALTWNRPRSMSLRLGWEGAAADAESTTPGGRRTARFLSMWAVILVSALPGPGAAEDEAPECGWLC
ncbi:hypothetical protein, partial [Xanthomonas graminis]